MRNPSPTSPPPRCPLPPALLLALAAAFLLALVSAALLHFRHPALPPPPPPDPPPPPAASLPPLSFSSTSAPLSAFPDLATHARESSRGLPWLLAFSRPLVPADRAAVAAAGTRILGFIPPRALLLEAPPDSRSALAALPGVADSSPLPPYRKIAPDLASAALSSPSAPVTVAVATTSPDDAPALADALASAAAVRLSANPRRTLAVATLPAADALRLARLPEVAWVELRGTPTLCNDRAQAADRLATAPVRDVLGLTGAGQLIAFADTGIGTGDLSSPHPDLAAPKLAAVPIRSDSWGTPSRAARNADS